MKLITTIFLLLAIGLLSSCSSNEPKETTDSVNTGTTDIKKNDTLLPFSGYWVNEEYYNSINKFKSPRKAQDNGEFIFIPERALKPTMMITGFHEGGPYLAVVKGADDFQLWEMQDDSLTGKLNNITIVAENKIKIGNTSFIKINPEADDEQGALVLEEILFKGIYTNAEGEIIEFKNNGEISGLADYQTYKPVIDYIGPGMQVDQVGFSRQGKEPEMFGFKFSNDTLNIYKLNCTTRDAASKECAEVEFGKLAYQLWRKK
ncbi:MAG: hypothetical protein M3R17_04785 [Bacteroidota bacterium]|nr:hypothetical protein [Bacteroidota bacterium]